MKSVLPFLFNPIRGVTMGAMEEELSVSDLTALTKQINHLDKQFALLNQAHGQSSADLKVIMEGQNKILSAQNLITSDLVRIVAKQEEKDKRLNEYKTAQDNFEATTREALKRAHARIDVVSGRIWFATGLVVAIVWAIENFYNP